MFRATVLMFVMGVSLAAKADTVGVSGTVDGGGDPQTGTLYAQSNGGSDGSYTIEQVVGPGVTGTLAPMSFHNNSNQLFPDRAGELLDGDGFAFTDTMDGVDYTVDIFAANGSYGAYVTGTDGTDLEAVNAQFMLTNSYSQSSVRNASLLRSDVAASNNLEAFTFSFTAAPSPAATPEPASFALMGTGLLGAAAMIRRRARKYTEDVSCSGDVTQ